MGLRPSCEVFGTLERRKAAKARQKIENAHPKSRGSKEMALYPRIARFRTVADLREHLAKINAPIPLDDSVLSARAGSPLAAPIEIGGHRVGNRWCIHPMEGWDATPDGLPHAPRLMAHPTHALIRPTRRACSAMTMWSGSSIATWRWQAMPQPLGLRWWI
jgi:hypothetical protein